MQAVIAFLFLAVVAVIIIGPGSGFLQELRDKIQLKRAEAALEAGEAIVAQDTIAEEDIDDGGIPSEELESDDSETEEGDAAENDTDGNSDATDETVDEATESIPNEASDDTEAESDGSPETTESTESVKASANSIGGLQRVGDFTIDDFKNSTIRDSIRPALSVRDLRTLSAIPRTRSELDAAHNRNKINSCEILAADGQFEVSTFTPFLTERDNRQIGKGLILPSIRKHVFSVGLDVAREDQSDLPLVSRSQILAYLRGHYVSIQARIKRDPLDNAKFLHHRPLAATVKYATSRKTEAFTEAVIASLRDMRSLGLYLPSDAPKIPENLRTIVIAHRNVMAGTGVKLDRARPDFELLFIRARESKDGESLELHAFGTTERREVLHYISKSRNPRRSADCGIKGTVAFTKYSHANLYPTEAVVRSTAVRGRTEFRMTDLSRFVQSLGLTGDALDNLNVVLDAMIDKRIISTPQPLQVSVR
jgi:hypothetical protein